MATEAADHRYLLAREMEMWRAETERTQNRLDVLQQGRSEATPEQAWYHYCVRKHQDVTGELDKIENPQRYSAAHATDSLDALDRQTE